MIYNVMLLSAAAGHSLLYSRYFAEPTEKPPPDAVQADFEAGIADAFEGEWARASSGFIVTEVSDQYVVAQLAGEYVIVVSGNDEHDEVALAEVVTLLAGVLKDCVGSKLQLSQFKSNAGKVVIGIDEAIDCGHLTSSDLDTVVKLSKMKAVSAKK